MCLQDLKIGRLKYHKTTFQLGTGTIVAQPNSNRVRVSFGWTSLLGGAAANFVFLGPTLGTTNIITQLTAASPWFALDIEEYGSLVQSQIGYFVGANVTGIIVETILSPTDKELSEL